MARFQLSRIFYVIVNSCVLQALHCVRKNLRLHGNLLKSHLASRVTVTLDNWHKKIWLHLLVNARKENYILCSILKHLLAKWAYSMPEGVIELHLL